MKKNIIILLLITTLTSCGYEPIYLKKNNLDLSIKDYELLGDKAINRKIVSLLNLKKSNKEKSWYTLKLDSKKLIESVAKNKAGDTTIFKLTLNIELILSQNDKLVKEKNFITSFTYNNIKNKFDLLQYQKNIEKNLIDKLSEEIIIFLKT
mgnify:CR=1 FL=1